MLEQKKCYICFGRSYIYISLTTYLHRYLFCCSYSHNVAPKGKYIAFVTSEAETDNPETELKPGVDLLGPIDEIFYETYDRYVPVNKSETDNCFISAVSGHSLLLPLDFVH